MFSEISLTSIFKDWNSQWREKTVFNNDNAKAR